MEPRRAGAALVTLVRYVDVLRMTQRERPFHIDAWVVFRIMCIESEHWQPGMTITRIAERRSRLVKSLSNHPFR